MNASEVFKILVASHIRDESRESFSVTRYPYTYAADFLRTHTDLIPGDVFDRVIPFPMVTVSRSQASHIRELWAEKLGLDDKLVAEILANAYLTENRVNNVPDYIRL